MTEPSRARSTAPLRSASGARTDSLEWLQTAVKALAVGLALAVAFVPRRRSLVQVAALAAAVLIAVELTAEHWFYLYIPWFAALALPALASLIERSSSSADPLSSPGGSSSRRPTRTNVGASQ